MTLEDVVAGRLFNTFLKSIEPMILLGFFLFFFLFFFLLLTIVCVPRIIARKCNSSS